MFSEFAPTEQLKQQICLSSLPSTEINLGTRSGGFCTPEQSLSSPSPSWLAMFGFEAALELIPTLGMQSSALEISWDGGSFAFHQPG